MTEVSNESVAEYRSSILNGIGEAILDVPDMQVLRKRTIGELLNEFERAWGIRPAAVAIPVTSFDGANFSNTRCGLPLAEAVNPERANCIDFATVINNIVSEGCDVYLTIVPGAHFLNVDPLQIVDSKGSTSRQLCIGKQATQEIIGVTLADALNLACAAVDSSRIRGTVCDIVDLWPMGATGGRLHLTCFCNECVERLEQFGAKDILQKFVTYPNPWNLLLAENDAKDGITFAEDFSSESTPDEIVGLSKSRQFVEVFGSQSPGYLEGLADDLLTFLRARHDHVVRSLDKCRAVRNDYLEQEVLGKEFDWNILCEGRPYSWSSGMFIDRLDHSVRTRSEAPATEIWCNPSSKSPISTSIPRRAYMWDRARYAVDSYFQYSASIADPRQRATTGLGRIPMEIATQFFNERMQRALGGEMLGVTSLIPLDPRKSSSMGELKGFVGVGLSQSIGAELVNSAIVAPHLGA